MHVGLQAKKVDDRFSTDLNNEIAPGYTVVDLDLNYGFKLQGVESAGIQFNVTNLLDEEYFGNISSGTGVRHLGAASISSARRAPSWRSRALRTSEPAPDVRSVLALLILAAAGPVPAAARGRGRPA